MYNRLHKYWLTAARLVWTVVLVMVAALMVAAHEVKHIRGQDGLMGDNVQEVYTDSRGLTWVGTNEEVCCYNGVDVVYFESAEKGAQRSVAHILEMPDGAIMLGTRGGHLIRVDILYVVFAFVVASVS